MKTLHFDVFSGASGDMILSSLIDLGVPLEYVRSELAKLHIPGFAIDVEKQKRSGIMCSHLMLDWQDRHEHLHGNHQEHAAPQDLAQNHHHVHDHQHGHAQGHGLHHAGHEQATFKNPGQILAIIQKAGYPQAVFSMCEKIIMRLAQAEAAVHGVPVDDVHFHEIGAIDTIIDVAGTCLCLNYLGVEGIYFSTLADGRGEVRTRHGVMPVPVPAVMKLCEGFSLRITNIESELLTPTGCAILVALGKQRESGILGSVHKTGYGCGDKVFENSPNALRVLLMESAPEGQGHGDAVICLESEMDHISGEIMADAAGRLMLAGALDVSWTPVFMKKGRPGYRLTVICDPEKMQQLADMIILHTRTLGIRVQRTERVIACREIAQSTLLNAGIQEKHCSFKGASFSKPEYESLAKLSEKTGRPVIELIEEYYKGLGGKHGQAASDHQ
jgi:pyridinium-3,5-bisthiocarboxylic acid mononucleotide nickel chelatase